MRIAFLALTLLTACSAVPESPEGEGEGLVAAAADIPPGVTVVERPEWATGDSFVLLRAGVVRQEFRVEATEQGYRLIDEESGLVLIKDRDFGDIGQERMGHPEAAVVHAPADTRYAWPLWVGKTWTCHFLRKTAGEVMPLIATYVVEAEEMINVPAGTLRCLRILRSTRPAGEGSYFPQHTIIWYAPEVGIEARWIEMGRLSELAEYHRQP
jgi:hypothetical protein